MNSRQRLFAIVAMILTAFSATGVAHADLSGPGTPPPPPPTRG
jgi:hypothetical protein